MKICHLIGSLQYGGAERQVVNLLNNLDGCEKHAVFLTDQPRAGFYDLLKNNITTCFIPIRLRAAPLYINKLTRCLRRNKIDVLQTHMFWSNLYGAIGGRLAGVPVIITTEHGIDGTWKKWQYRWLERQVITKLVDMRICVSQDTFNNRKKQYGIAEEKLITIMNGIPVRPLFRTKGVNTNKRIILGTVGRLVEAKDHSTLLVACSRLKEWGIDFVCYIIGDGPLLENLEKQIHSLLLQDYVKLVGYQSNIDEWLDRIDIFIMSSIREGHPIALLEAMASGLPIVATKVGGIPDALEHGKDGLLVPASAPEALAISVRSMLDNKDLRAECGRNAYQRLKDHFSIQAVCKSYMDLYQDLLQVKNETVAR